MLNLVSVNKANIFGKKVFLRADLDVPLRELKTQNSKLKTEIEDDTRLVSALPTMEYLLKQNAQIIIGGHLGRPKINQESFDGVYPERSRGAQDKSGIRNQESSLFPVAKWFTNNPIIHDSLFMIQETKVGEFDGWKISESLSLLENLRFYRGEEENDPAFSKKLASLADIYVNDAFAVCHRNHASIVGVPKFLPHFAGLRLQKEVGVLSGVLENPKRPLVVIIGGAKIETKLPLVEKMYKFADYILVGGKIAREEETLLTIINKHVEAKRASLIIGELNNDKTDIKEKSVKKFLQIIKNAKTVVWNGPVGLVQSSIHSTGSGQGFKVQSSEEDTERGTRELAKGIAESRAYTIVGGGDTVGFLKRLELLDRFSFVSTGGGAMLAFLSQKNMPGLKALISPN